MTFSFDDLDLYTQAHPQPHFWDGLSAEQFFNDCRVPKNEHTKSLMYLTNSATDLTPWGFWALSAMRTVDPEQEQNEYRVLIHHATKQKNTDLLFTLFGMAKTSYHYEQALGIVEDPTNDSSFVFEFLKRCTPTHQDVYVKTPLRHAICRGLLNALDPDREEQDLPTDWLFSPSVLSHLSQQNSKNSRSAILAGVGVLAENFDHPQVPDILRALFLQDERSNSVADTVMNSLLREQDRSNRGQELLLDLVFVDTQKSDERSVFWIRSILHREYHETEKPLLTKTLSFFDKDKLGHLLGLVFAAGQQIRINHDSVIQSGEVLCSALPQDRHAVVLLECMRATTKNGQFLKSAFEKMHLTAEMSHRDKSSKLLKKM